ncbi:hypothetical protein HK097_000047 [Rhizophlyctis rosea]|uniref:Uncharacterized protein n=1 Tax=Rhizophlyctis rosea TaxID=64517 RepID=A0AAD5SS70_9FUNG|nr:hypothetical protein HK097_000047 [Rhizophlyctis rosea]
MSTVQALPTGDVNVVKTWLQSFGEVVGVEGLADKWTQGNTALLRMVSRDMLKETFGGLVGNAMYNAIHENEPHFRSPGSTSGQTAFRILNSSQLRALIEPLLESNVLPAKRESLMDIDTMPNDVHDISPFFELVGREAQTRELLQLFKTQIKLIGNPRSFAEPMKQVCFPTCVGTAGKGKTTFARLAFGQEELVANELGATSIECDIIGRCVKAGRVYRIGFEDLSRVIEANRPTDSLGIRVLYEAFKYVFKNNLSFEDFRTHMFNHLTASTLPFSAVHETIMSFFVNCAGPTQDLILLNLDETNYLFDNNLQGYLQEVLSALSTSIVNGKCVFALLTGTHATMLFDVVKSSRCQTEEIRLPLLTPEETSTVILDIANRTTPEITTLSPHLEYILELLGVVPRYMECLIWSMAALGTAHLQSDAAIDNTKFRHAGFRHFLSKMQNDPAHCNHLLQITNQRILQKYHQYRTIFGDIAEDIPTLVAHTLFGLQIKSRSMKLGKLTVEELEQKDVIFLDGQNRMHLPFVHLHFLYAKKRSRTMPRIRALESLDNDLSSDQNEGLTAAIVAFRLWAVIGGQSGSGMCKLSDLMRLRPGQTDIDITVNHRTSFEVKQCPKQVTSSNWAEFYATRTTAATLVYKNAASASFADSFILSNPPILIQDKQVRKSREAAIAGRATSIVPSGMLKAEHDKCRGIGKHIFVFVTDDRQRMTETLDDDEVVVDVNDMGELFGHFLAFRKAFSIGTH